MREDVEKKHFSTPLCKTPLLCLHRGPSSSRRDPLEKRQYIRFIIDRTDEDSHVEQGVFQAVARALECHSITGRDAEQLNDLEAWFGKNLDKPTAFERDKLRLGICWFKTDATEHISRLWQMVQILEAPSPGCLRTVNKFYKKGCQGKAPP